MPSSRPLSDDSGVIVALLRATGSPVYGINVLSPGTRERERERERIYKRVGRVYFRAAADAGWPLISG